MRKIGIITFAISIIAKWLDLPSLHTIRLCEHSFFNYTCVDLKMIGEDLSEDQISVDIQQNALASLKKISRKQVHEKIIRAFFVKRDYQPSISFS